MNFWATSVMLLNSAPVGFGGASVSRAETEIGPAIAGNVVEAIAAPVRLRKSRRDIVVIACHDDNVAREAAGGKLRVCLIEKPSLPGTSISRSRPPHGLAAVCRQAVDIKKPRHCRV